MTSSAVSLKRCQDYSPQKIRQVLESHFSLLGGIEKFVSRSDTVLIKPNLIVPKPREFAVQTDPTVILELAKILKDYGAKPFVADSPAWGDTLECVRILGLADSLKKIGVEVKQLNKPQRCEIDGATVSISSIALEADRIINLPKLKSHQQLGATIAVKNMFGTVSGKAKAMWHFRKGAHENDFCDLLIGIYKLFAPTITIIDAVIAMEGAGPISGTAKKLGWTIAATDPIAAEVVTCRLIDFDPDSLPIIRRAKQTGFGCSDIKQIEILGDDHTDHICRDFQTAPQIPLKFTLPRVIRSISKQLLIYIKQLIAR